VGDVAQRDDGPDVAGKRFQFLQTVGHCLRAFTAAKIFTGRWFAVPAERRGLANEFGCRRRGQRSGRIAGSCLSWDSMWVTYGGTRRSFGLA